MKMSIIAAAAALAVTATPAMADQAARNWISPAALAKVLEHQGYRMTKVEADDGHWEGEMTRAGKVYDFHADPRSGRLLKVERDHD